MRLHSETMSKNIPSTAFLSHLQSQFPSTSPWDNPWHIAATVAFSSLNRPEAIPAILEFVLRDFTEKEDRLRVVRALRDALLKSSFCQGFPKVSSAACKFESSIRYFPFYSGRQCVGLSVRGHTRRAPGHRALKVCLPVPYPFPIQEVTKLSPRW